MSLPWLRDMGPPSSRQRETGKRLLDFFQSGLCGWKSGGLGGGGWWDSHEDFGVGFDFLGGWGGNRDKQGSDGDDDDGGTGTRPDKSAKLPSLAEKLRRSHPVCAFSPAGISQDTCQAVYFIWD